MSGKRRVQMQWSCITDAILDTIIPSGLWRAWKIGKTGKALRRIDPNNPYRVNRHQTWAIVGIALVEAIVMIICTAFGYLQGVMYSTMILPGYISWQYYKLGNAIRDCADTREIKGVISNGPIYLLLSILPEVQQKAAAILTKVFQQGERVAMEVADLAAKTLPSENQDGGAAAGAAVGVQAVAEQIIGPFSWGTVAAYIVKFVVLFGLFWCINHDMKKLTARPRTKKVTAVTVPQIGSAPIGAQPVACAVAQPVEPVQPVPMSIGQMPVASQPVAQMDGSGVRALEDFRDDMKQQ